MGINGNEADEIPAAVEVSDDELAVLASIILADVEESYHELVANDTQRRRRTFVRAAVSGIEGVTHILKRFCLEGSSASLPHWTFGELVLLKEVGYSLHDNGSIQERSSYPQPYANFKFALQSFLRIHSPQFKLEWNGKGWAALRDAVKIRNRIVHPRSKLEMDIADLELKSSIDAFAFVAHRGIGALMLSTLISRMEILLLKSILVEGIPRSISSTEQARFFKFAHDFVGGFSDEIPPREALVELDKRVRVALSNPYLHKQS